MIRSLLIIILLFFPNLSVGTPIRIKDLVNFDGVRGNDLIGYGLIVGLNGSGDSFRNSPFTEEIMLGLLERLGVNVTDDSLRPKNVAAVIVTATLPPFSRAGSQIDVNVSAIGDAKSLLGGTLIMTPLSAADGEIYAVAQGAVLSSGVEASGDAARVVFGVPTTGTIPSGARVEREVNFELRSMTEIRLALRSPDFTTAARIESAINKSLGRNVAELLDGGTILIKIGAAGQGSPAHLIGRLENILVQPEAVARVVIDHKSGTIVMGADVRVSRVAVSQGNLSIRVRETPAISQPNPFSLGETFMMPDTFAEIRQEAGIGFTEITSEASLSDVISGLNALGVRPRDLIEILRAIHTAGALHAELLIN